MATYRSVSLNDDEPLRQSEPAHMATTTIKVDGMTCGACTSAVEAGFKDLPGAGAVSVSLVMGRAVIHHNPEKLSADQVVEIIEDRGFDAEILSTNLPASTPFANVKETAKNQAGYSGSKISTTTLAVEGMTCGACTSSVETGFKDVAGVKTMRVSLLSERAVVEHDTTIISVEQLAEIIEDRGFGATVVDTKIQEDLQEVNGTILDSGLAKANTVATTVAIEGMTCGACTSAVEGAFTDMPGLIHFNISLLAERAVISHDSSKLPIEKIIEIIEDAGFDAKLVSSEVEGSPRAQSSTSVQLKIYGLPDGLAATALEDLLREKTGVTGVVINLSTSRATLTYNPSLIGLRALVAAVEVAGYNALIADSGDNNAQLESLAKTREIHEWRLAFFFSLSFAVPVFSTSMLIPMFLPALDFGSIVLFPGIYLADIICLFLTIPVQFGIGKRFYISAFKSLKHRSPTMDVLVVLGTSAAFFFSVFAMIIAFLIPPHNRPGTVFDTSTMLITFITLGRWLENRAKGQTSKALSRLMSLAPSMATIYEDPIAAEKAAEGWDLPFSPAVEKHGDLAEDDAKKNNTPGQKVIPTELIEVGDIVILRPGDKVPADGTVTRGESYVDESMITGEAMPILKTRSSLLIAGTVNGAGRVDFRVSRAGKDTQLSQIVNLVQEAQTSRAPIQQMADRLAGYFVPIILLLGLTTFVGWMVLSHILPYPPKIFDDNQSGGKFMVCLKLCISVIVFACPCALGLATPTAVMVGTGVGAENGILVKGGAALETATRITHVILDKTGTLTEGKMNIAKAELEPAWSANDWRRRLWWSIVGLAEMSSEHPIAKAIFEASKEQLGLRSDEDLSGAIGKFDVFVGKGITATVEPASNADRARYEVTIGNASFLKSNGITVPTSVEECDDDSVPASSPSKSSALTGVTRIHVAISSQYSGTLSLSDTLKPTAPAAIMALHKMGITTSLVTGDTYSSARNIAELVGIAKDQIRASVSPGQKKDIVAELQWQGDTVAMVGDGINDSPALASADIGIALSSGTDIAMDAADIVLMRAEDLLSIPAALCLSRTIFNRIKLNLAWAVIYNVFGLPFAMGMFLPFGGIMLPPMGAGAAMALSSVSVVSSSLLLKRWRRPGWLDVDFLEQEIKEGRASLGKSRRRGISGYVMRAWSSGLGVFRKKRDQDRGQYVPLSTVDTSV
jgi:P-type Cu+ transporter